MIFMSFSAVFQSFQDDGWMITKQTPVLRVRRFRLKQDLNPGPLDTKPTELHQGSAARMKVQIDACAGENSSYHIRPN